MPDSALAPAPKGKRAMTSARFPSPPQPSTRGDRILGPVTGLVRRNLSQYRGIPCWCTIEVGDLGLYNKGAWRCQNCRRWLFWRPPPGAPGRPLSLDVTWTASSVFTAMTCGAGEVRVTERMVTLPSSLSPGWPNFRARSQAGRPRTITRTATDHVGGTTTQHKACTWQRRCVRH